MDGAWLVSLAPGVDAAKVARPLARAAGGKAARIYRHALNGFEYRGTEDQVEELARDPRVLTITPDRKLSLLAETLAPGVRRIAAEDPTANDAHEAGYTGAGVSVAVLDTGIDLTHPDLVANIDATRGRNCMNLAQPPVDGHGHGTHVAGIIAATAGNGIGVIGVAPEATIVPVKVLDDTGQRDNGDRCVRRRLPDRPEHRRQPGEQRPGRQHEPRRHWRGGRLQRRQPASGGLRVGGGGHHVRRRGRQQHNRRVDVLPGELLGGHRGLGDD